MSSKAAKKSIGYTGEADRHDAIVGWYGDVAVGGGGLSICLFFKSGRGVKRAITRIGTIGGRVEQLGDAEVSATLPAGRIRDALDLIRVSRLRPPNAGSFCPGTEHTVGAESPGRAVGVQ